VALTQIIVLAIMQAVSDVFPVGAEGHFAVFSHLTSWSAPGPGFAIAAQTGLLLALMAYFARDLWDMVLGVIRTAKGKNDPGARLAAQLLVATIPTVGLGFAFEHYIGDRLNSLMVLGWAIVGFGILLFLLDRMTMTVKRIEHATYLDTILIGVLQVLALVPGTCRAGITMTMARLLGYERPDSARLSMLLAIPMLMVLIGRDVFYLIQNQGPPITNIDILSGVVSFFAGLIAVAILMSWLRRSTFTPFVVYRLLLGAVVLALAYGGIEI
jgi:undecaprenyl-diphosphatase